MRTLLIILAILLVFPLLAGGVLTRVSPFNFDDMVIPGGRVGSITMHTTEQELKMHFFTDDVHRVLYHAKNGDVYCASEVYIEGADSITVIWDGSPVGNYKDSYHFPRYEVYQDAKKRCDALPPMSRPIFLVLENRFSRWHVNERNFGRNLGQLEKANRAPIHFSACDCDRGGEVVDWNNGALSSLKVKITLPYEYPNVARGEFFERHSKKPNDIVRSSDLSDEVKSQIFFDEIIVYFNDKENIGRATS